MYQWGFLCLIAVSCSPLLNSLHDEKHQWEIKLHEVQTNLDDLKHDINCFQTELQILDGRIKYYENALALFKQQDIEKQQVKIEQIGHELRLLEKKWISCEKFQEGEKESIERLASYANETLLSLSQFKTRIKELEQDILAQNRRLEEFGKIKENIELLTKSFKPSYKIYKVRSGDSLEKIAHAHNTNVQKIKKMNGLEKDLIVIDQELKIPFES